MVSTAPAGALRREKHGLRHRHDLRHRNVRAQRRLRVIAGRLQLGKAHPTRVHCGAVVLVVVLRGPLFKLVCRFDWAQSDIRTCLTEL